MKFDRILVPIDFSDQSRFALAEADEIASTHGGALTILHVHQIVQLAVLEFTFVEPAPKIATICAAAEKQLAEWSKDLKTQAARRHIRVETGQPLTVILDESAKHDLIVMPTHGRTGPTHFLLGSVAERVVQGAKCSVLVVKNRLH